MQPVPDKLTNIDIAILIVILENNANHEYTNV